MCRVLTGEILQSKVQKATKHYNLGRENDFLNNGLLFYLYGAFLFYHPKNDDFTARDWSLPSCQHITEFYFDLKHLLAFCFHRGL